jgi:hypothetical protein
MIMKGELEKDVEGTDQVLTSDIIMTSSWRD